MRDPLSPIRRFVEQRARPSLELWMHDPLTAARGFVEQRVWSTSERFVELIHPVPLLGALAIFALLAMVGQMHEIYLAYLELPYDASRLAHIALAGGALALLSAALYYANYTFTKIVIDAEYSKDYNHDRYKMLRAWQNTFGAAIAALPWLGLAWGLWSAATNADRHVTQLKAISGLDGLPEKAGIALSALNGAISKQYWALLLVGVIGFACVIFLHYFRTRRRIRYTSVALLVFLFVMVVFVLPSYMPEDESVRIFRGIGPLAMIVLDALLVFAFIIVLTLLSRKERLPIITPMIAVALIASFLTFDVSWIAHLMAAMFVFAAILALVSRRWPLFWLTAIVAWLLLGPPPSGHHGTLLFDDGKESQKVERRFQEWLDARRDDRAAYARTKGGKPYPAFIISVEGGGIYAAAAASAFLSRLQELCPNFAQHVFAISGVSGGAVGAAIFQSNVRHLDVRNTGCAPAGEQSSDQPAMNVASVVQHDHLSPLLGFIVADLLGKFDDRAKGLEQSLVHSTGSLLGGSFEEHWDPKKAAPALVLNATWVETGYRVAFAPFRLRGLGGETLYSFGDLGSDDVTLARAAVVSARFPGIVPAFMMSGDERRWNFVDGGYKDSSGASTALDIFKAIEALSAKEGVKPRLILVTSARPAFDPKKIHGMRTRDTLAPIITLLSVRDRLAEEAVTRTIAIADPPYAASLHTPTSLVPREDWSARLVEIDQQKFSLALGWRISKSTHEIVRLLMGDPDLCTDKNLGRVAPSDPTPNAPADKDAGEKTISARTLLENSCLMKSVVDLLTTPKGPKQAAH